MLKNEVLYKKTINKNSFENFIYFILLEFKFKPLIYSQLF